MKNILFIIGFMFVFALVADAQTKTLNIPIGSSFYDVTTGAEDTISATQTTYTYIFNATQHYPCTQDLYINLDSISASKASVALYGKKFANSAYAAIGSAVTWAGVASATNDTTIVISNATETRYRYYKVVVTRVAGKTLIGDLQLKLYFE